MVEPVIFSDVAVTSHVQVASPFASVVSIFPACGSPQVICNCPATFSFATVSNTPVPMAIFPPLP